MRDKLMKAVVHYEYGGPEVLQLKEVPKPVPKENEVLIKVHATTVNRTDCGFRRPEYLIVRVFAGMFRPKNHILGSELAGVIESVGAKVTRFKEGDAVFGLSTYRFGAHAEYICIKETGSIALKPSNYSFEEAAAVCDGLMLGINCVRAVKDIKGKKVLINGASGSIGSACVQLAVHYGAEVTAVCGTKNTELIRSLGAFKVVDFEKEDFTQLDEQFDAVLDVVGKSSFFKCKKILKPRGFYLSSELGHMSQNIFLPLLTFFTGGKRVKFPIPTDSRKDTEYFRELIEGGHYKAVIDRTYTLDQVTEATRYVETGMKTGNVVVVVSGQ